MRYLGLDLGTKSLGISITDKTNTIIKPFKTIFFKENDYESIIDKLKDIINNNEIDKIILGLPKNMDGSLGFAGERSLNFQKLLQKENIDVILVDERMTTIMAEDIIHQNNEHIKNTKKKIDAIAASLILESYLKGLKWF